MHSLKYLVLLSTLCVITHAHKVNKILQIVEIEDRYIIRNDGQQIYICTYKQKILIDITCVGLALARPSDITEPLWPCLIQVIPIPYGGNYYIV